MKGWLKFTLGVILSTACGYLIGELLVINPIGRVISASIFGIVITFFLSIYISKKLGVE